MKEEDNILKKVGTENAFRVPEGYFENFTSELMNRLPEKEKLAFEQKAYDVGEGETLGLYGSYVCRCGIDYPRVFL